MFKIWNLGLWDTLLCHFSLDSLPRVSLLPVLRDWTYAQPFWVWVLPRKAALAGQESPQEPAALPHKPLLWTPHSHLLLVWEALQFQMAVLKLIYMLSWVSPWLCGSPDLTHLTAALLSPIRTLNHAGLMAVGDFPHMLIVCVSWGYTLKLGFIANVDDEFSVLLCSSIYFNTGIQRA